jgi:phosphatidylglycerophosphatase A
MRSDQVLVKREQDVRWRDRAAKYVASGFGAGHVSRAPGTVGTVVGVVLYVPLTRLALPAYGVVVFVLFLLGVWCCHVADRELGTHDHPSIVWDEIVGYLITMLLAPPSWKCAAIGFVLFRLFDIWKPFPIRRLERLPGGLGIMTDDAFAGLYALVVMQIVVWLAGDRFL